MQKRAETLLPQTRKTSRSARSLIFHALQPDPQLRDTVTALLQHRWMAVEEEQQRIERRPPQAGAGEHVPSSSKTQSSS